MPSRACSSGSYRLASACQASVELNQRTTYKFAINAFQTNSAPYITVLNHQMSYYIVNQIYDETNMGYHRDRLVTRIDPRLSFEQYADHSHYRYVHLKGI